MMRNGWSSHARAGTIVRPSKYISAHHAECAISACKLKDMYVHLHMIPHALIGFTVGHTFKYDG
jgi:hypothetical protein